MNQSQFRDELEELVRVYQEEDEDLLQDFAIEELTDKSMSITMTVDITAETYDLAIRYKNGGLKTKYGEVDDMKKMPFNFQTILAEIKTILKKFKKDADKIKEEFGVESDDDIMTPVTPNQTFDSFEPEFDQATNQVYDMHISEEEEEENLMDIQAKHCDLIFQSSTCTLISGIHNARVQIHPKSLSSPELISNCYNMENKPPIILQIQFTPEFIKDAKLPHIHYKHDETLHGDPQLSAGFGEQCLNLALKYINERWLSLVNNEKTKDSFKNKGSNDKTKLIGTLEFFKNNKMIGDGIQHEIQLLKRELGEMSSEELLKPHLVKKYINLGAFDLAKSLALYFTNFNIEKAIQFYNLECEGKLDNAAQILELLHTNSSKRNHWDFETNPNFFIEFIAFVNIWLMNSLRCCCICSEELKASPQHIEKPHVCTKFSCMFSYVAMKMCSSIQISITPLSIANDIKENDEVVDLLISMCYSAATNQRRDIIFDPFPPKYQEGDVRKYDDVVKYLEMLPSVAEMSQHANNDDELRQFLGDQCFYLVQWILTTDRVALLRIPEKKRILEMNTNYQYMMLVDEPKKTSEFNALRKKYGSYFAFHGSATENWHSIFRKGLIVASGTKFQTTGAAYGTGIYCAPDSATSLSYAKTGKSWGKSKFGDSSNLKCLSIVEIVKHPDVPHVPNPYYVITQPQYVTTRFFLYYPLDTQVNATASNLNLKQFIE